MRVAVVGGGAVGLATAFFLEKAGADPVVLEAGRVGGGCSLGNGGWICPSLAVPVAAPGLTWRALLRARRLEDSLFVKLFAPGVFRWLVSMRRHCRPVAYERGLRALVSFAEGANDRYEALASDGVVFERGRSGLLFVSRTSNPNDGPLRPKMDALARSGGACRIIAADELREVEPLLRPGFGAGLLAESEGHVRPETVTQGLAGALRSRGAEVRENAAVEAFVTRSAEVRAVAMRDDPVKVDAVVLAAGVETGRLAQQLGATIPMTAGKGCSLTIDQPRERLRRPLYFADAMIGCSPYSAALRFFGGMEFSGVNRRLDERRIQAMRRGVAESLEVSGLDRAKAWVGMRPMVPDTLPIIGRLPGYRNAYVATGHQMLGMTLAPATGAALAHLILGTKPDVDLEPFSPMRTLR